MAHFKEQSEPFVFDFKKLLMALSDKEAVAQSEVDAFMENCAKRWLTREGTYQLMRRRLKPDVRDSPEYPGADIDMADVEHNRQTHESVRAYLVSSCVSREEIVLVCFRGGPLLTTLVHSQLHQRHLMQTTWFDGALLRVRKQTANIQPFFQSRYA